MKKSALLLQSGTLILSLIIFSCVKKENSVTFPNQSLSIDENSETGTIVGKILASDKNNLSLSYSIISGNTNSAFDISATDGIITVKNTDALDFETIPVFDLLIEAINGKNEKAD